MQIVCIFGQPPRRPRIALENGCFSGAGSGRRMDTNVGFWIAAAIGGAYLLGIIVMILGRLWAIYRIHSRCANFCKVCASSLSEEETRFGRCDDCAGASKTPFAALRAWAHGLAQALAHAVPARKPQDRCKDGCADDDASQRSAAGTSATIGGLARVRKFEPQRP